jgi:hypothetical protein
MIRELMPRPIFLLLPLVLLSGCAPAGSGSVDTGRFKGASKAVATTLKDLADAGRKKDGARVCAQLLSQRRVDALDRGNGSCRSALDNQLDDADVFDMDVDSIRVAGQRATARVRSTYNGHKVARTVGFVFEQRRWRLDSVSR